MKKSRLWSNESIFINTGEVARFFSFLYFSPFWFLKYLRQGFQFSEKIFRPVKISQSSEFCYIFYLWEKSKISWTNLLFIKLIVYQIDCLSNWLFIKLIVYQIDCLSNWFSSNWLFLNIISYVPSTSIDITCEYIHDKHCPIQIFNICKLIFSSIFRTNFRTKNFLQKYWFYTLISLLYLTFIMFFFIL